MAETTSIDELTDRVQTLELELAALRSKVNGDEPKSNWVESLSGSMKDFPKDSYDEIMEMGRAAVAGELEVAESL